MCICANLSETTVKSQALVAYAPQRAQEDNSSSQKEKRNQTGVLEKLSSEEQLLRLTNVLDMFLFCFFSSRGITNEQANYCMFESSQKVNMKSGE